MTVSEATELFEHWREEPPLGAVVRAAFGVRSPEATGSAELQLPAKTELTQAEYDELVARMKANAEMYGRRLN